MNDLMQLDTKTTANAGFDLEIINPKTLEGTGLVITILGEDSEEYRKITTSQQQRRIKKSIAQRSRNEVPLDEIDEDALDTLAACTKGWYNKDKSDVTLDGKPFPFSTSNARTLYERIPVIRAQVEAGIKDRANFMPPSV